MYNLTNKKDQYLTKFDTVAVLQYYEI